MKIVITSTTIEIYRVLHMTEQIVIETLKEAIVYGVEVRASTELLLHCGLLSCKACPLSKHLKGTTLSCADLQGSMHRITPFREAYVKIKQTYPELFI